MHSTTYLKLLSTLGLVTLLSASAFPQTLAHRYSFTSTLNDSVGTANGTLVNNGGGSVFDGSGNFDLNPGSSSVDIIQLPGGIITGLNTNNITYEIWFTRLNTENNWSRLFDFGNTNGSADFTSQYLTVQQFFNYSLQFEVFAPGANTEDVWREPIFQNSDGEVYCAITYNYTGGLVSMYVGCPNDGIPGSLVNDFGLNPGQSSWRSQSTYPCTIPISAILDTNNLLGGSQYGDPPVNAAYDEFRVYKGVLSPLQVALHAAWGPDVTNLVPGPIQSLSLTVSNSVLTVPDASQLYATANFSSSGAIPSANNVDVTAVPPVTYTTSNPNVAIVTANGFVEAIGTGTATITAHFSNEVATTSVTVTGTAAAVLVHDYHFSDATHSTTAADSVGGANGTLITSGNSSFNGSQLYLNQNTSANGTDYVSLPSGLLNTITNGAVTFEVWVTQAGSPSPQDWTEVFDFGDSSAGSGIQGGDADGLKLIASEGYSKEALAWDDSPNGFLYAGDQNYWKAPRLNDVSGENYVAVVYDWTLGKVFMYRNGVPYLSDVGTVNATSLSGGDLNNWLGQAQSTTLNGSGGSQAVPNFSGLYNEFRVWDGALTAAQINDHALKGPNENVIAPVLNVVKTGSNLVISWLVAGSSGYSLYSETSLNNNASWPGSFTAVGGVVSNNGTNSVTVGVTGASKFFILHNP